MRINKATILKSRRLTLRNIESIVWTPGTDMQIILGTNGCGKSSLVELLTCLPAHSSDFNVGGNVTIEIEHDAESYQCISDFTKGAKYSLLHLQGDQWVELNEGRTATVQRELCKQIFKITPEIHQLLIGRLRFTDMAPAVRKEWIKLFTPTDLTFAFRLYNDIKTANRDTSGALKHLSNRISVETSKLLDMVGVDKMELLARQLKEELNILMLNKEQGLRRNWDAESQLSNLLKNIERCSTAIIELPLSKPEFVHILVPHGLAEIEDLISENRQETSLAESMLSVYTGEYMNLEGLLNTLQTTGAEGIDELSARVSDLEIDETRLLGNITEFMVTNNTEEIRNDTAMIFDTLVDIFTNMPDNSDRRYNQEAFATASQRATTVKYEIDRRLNRISQMEDRLAHLTHTDSTECPQCKHTFKPGARPDEDKMLVASIETLRAENQVLSTELTELTEYTGGADVYLAFIRRYKNITNQYPRLSALWNVFATDNMFSLRPRMCLSKLYVWQADVNTSVVLESVMKERKSLSEALDHASRLSSTGNGHFTERGQHLSNMISETTDRVQVMRQQRKELLAYRDEFLKLAELKAEVGRDLESVDRLRDEIMQVHRDDLIGSLIDQHQTTLALTQNSLNQKQTLEDIVNDLKESAKSLALDKEAYQILEDVLSPTDGFISEQLHGTIHSIVRQLNAIIGAIWTYDVTVHPCGSDDGVLDYKFPLHIENEERDDIYKGSEGQREIIDFAFRILAYSHLNLINYPLYLDETGRTMDETHRANIMSYIKENINARQFSQAFLISHYAANHGSFLNAEVVVLDNANIVTPDVYNTHFEIGYI